MNEALLVDEPVGHQHDVAMLLTVPLAACEVATDGWVDGRTAGCNDGCDVGCQEGLSDG